MDVDDASGGSDRREKDIYAGIVEGKSMEAGERGSGIHRRTTGRGQKIYSQERWKREV